MSKIRHGIPISSARFRWTHGNGYAEASDLKDVLKLHQVYDDACDEGFTVDFPVGDPRTFVQTSEVKDREHEVEMWLYMSVSERTGRIDKPAVRLTITIFND